MKKILFAMFAVAIMFASCSKESKLNRKLDGSWNLVTYDGAALATGESEVVKFDKDKKGKGTLTYTATGSGLSVSFTGTYELDKDEKITITITGSTANVETVVDYSKTDLTIKDTAGKLSVYKKM